MDVEKKMDMSLDDIIKSSRGGNERRKPGDATSGGPKSAGPKAAGSQKKGPQAGRNQGKQHSTDLAPRQNTMKKQARRAPIHVNTTNTGRFPQAMSITINNAPKGSGRKGRRSPPPGFATNRPPIFVNNRSMQPPPGLARGGRGVQAGPSRIRAPPTTPRTKPATLNERFSQFSQSGTPAVAVALKAVSNLPRNRRSNNKRPRNKTGNRGQATPMEQ